ncbi:MAG TPA: glycosyltransferase family 2 protein [Thermoanaerobaculaceae bacterium]|nr:glycosyltransferase family 2 protein [Thermoanaerobaculaceae bacterium]HPS79681.1 glycosyltransferase family 2 protein [Thermoanaerobaculaceae bacterium]
MSVVDVVIVVHNHAPTLTATLRGLASQTLAPARVVAVDNASSDGSRSILAATDLANIEVVQWDDNHGFSAAANEGIRRTQAPWVLSLNPDCRLAPDFLASLVAAGMVHERVGAACGLLLRGAGTTLEATGLVDSAGLVASAAGRHFDRAAARRLRPELERPAWVFGATGATALLRRAALDDVAYPGREVFDEGFFAYREDADLAWRLQRRGWRCLYWPVARGWHGRGLRPEAGRRGTATINRLGVRNRFLLLWSNADWRWRLACFPWWWLRDLQVLAACLTVERGSLGGLREAWRRRDTQRQRGRENASRAAVSGWRLASWCLPGRRVRGLEA